MTKERREERQSKIEEEKTRCDTRDKEMEEQKAAWEQDNADAIERWELHKKGELSLEEGEDPPAEPIFDLEDRKVFWDHEHPAILIPEEVIDEVDNDWLVTEDMRDTVIAEFTAA